MESLICGLIKPPHLTRIAALALASIAAFFLGRHWSAASPNLLFYTPTSTPHHHVAVSPNANASLDISTLIASPPPPSLLPPPPPPPPPSPPPRFGIVDENGAMADDFEVGTVDPDMAEPVGNETGSGSSDDDVVRVRVSKFKMCPDSMREYIPCMDNEEAIKKLSSTERGERFERHCPGEGKGLDCLVPAPKNYKTPIPWPRSRDET